MSRQEEIIDKFVQFFKEYLDENENLIYLNQLTKILTTSPKHSMEINWEHLNAFNPELAEELLENPEDVILAAEDAIQIVIQEEFFKKNSPKIHARFYELLKTYSVKELGIKHRNKFVQVEGIVAKTGRIDIFAPRIAFVCKDCGNIMIRIQKPFGNAIKPKKCEACGGKEIEIDTNESQFLDIQQIWIRDPSDKRTKIKAILLDDLVDTVSTEDKIIVTGILRLVSKEKRSPITFEKLLEVNHVTKQTKTEGQK
ncbi:hypothetical protein K1720_10185 [Thermococcus argininiproducens]|uniref:Minichromosome maintenance protein MCM n=1 Tax=Thermococcus argininiproducens TaxID=2866384 RepID=A0A9E7M9E8_9EURY|nr:hypothetical protein [Thermococcus argininiproducens]USG99836.1 hypothetical protein K1720_10185 [Thermococcus argininiproducens]